MSSLYLEKIIPSLESPLINLGEQFSGGEKKRLQIAKALLSDYQLYIFDEPTANLDHTSKQAVLKEIASLKKNAIVIIISHDTEVKKFSDEIIEL